MQVLIRTDRLLVEQMESPDVTEGGIILPNQSKVKQAWATVLLIGPEVEGIEPEDRIAFADFSGVNVELETDDGKKEYLILSQDDVLLVLREEPKFAPLIGEQGLNQQELNYDDSDNDITETVDETEQGPQENSEVHTAVE